MRATPVLLVALATASTPGACADRSPSGRLVEVRGVHLRVDRGDGRDLARLPHARLLILPDAGDATLQTRPEIVNRIVADVLSAPIRPAP